MSQCNDMSIPELSHQMIVQSIRLYFAVLGSHFSFHNPEILDRAVSQKRALIDLVEDVSIRKKMHRNLDQVLSGKRSERTFHISIARMQWNIYQWSSENSDEEVEVLKNYYVEPFLNVGVYTTRLLYLRFLGKLCVLTGGMSTPDFNNFELMLDEAATLQEAQVAQGFIFASIGFMSAVISTLPDINKANEIYDLVPNNWDKPPTPKGLKLFYTNLAEAFNPIPGVCE